MLTSLIPVKDKEHYWTLNYETVIRINKPTGETIYITWIVIYKQSEILFWNVSKYFNFINVHENAFAFRNYNLKIDISEHIKNFLYG